MALEGEPVLRHHKDHIYKSMCTFFDRDERRCTVYTARPLICRTYPSGERCGYYEFLQFERDQHGGAVVALGDARGDDPDDAGMPAVAGELPQQGREFFMDLANVMQQRGSLDLLDFTSSRLGRGIPVERKETDLGELIRETVAEVHVNHPKVRFHSETLGDVSANVDPRRTIMSLVGAAALLPATG